MNAVASRRSVPGQAWKTGSSGGCIVEEALVKILNAQGGVAPPQAWHGRRVLFVAGADSWRLGEDAGVLWVQWRDAWTAVLEPSTRSITVGRGLAGSTCLICLLGRGALEMGTRLRKPL